MTIEELKVKGYCLAPAAWGVHVILEDVTDRNNYQAARVIAEFVVHFDRPLKTEAAERRGWEAAEVDFVKRRLS